ncbi:hypothetical protein cypCar_00030185 [Cyprinus carpio]|nr:hypothetical protein cypCar_00030185 [Cyprinus carpio]
MFKKDGEKALRISCPGRCVFQAVCSYPVKPSSGMNQKGLYVNFGRATPRYVQHHKHTLLPPSGQTVHVPRVQVQVLSNSLQTSVVTVRVMPSRTEDYEVLLTIGCGSYGKCQKIKRKSDGKILVWKVLDYGTMAEAEKQMLVSEVNLLRELKHPNIVRYYDRIIDRTNTTLYIVMEYCEGGDLASLINRCIKDRRYLEEQFTLCVMAQLSLALKECHGRSNGSSTVLHRDLKPANIFLDVKQNVKLGDFGLARILNHDTSFAKTFVGTPYYMSPVL